MEKQVILQSGSPQPDQTSATDGIREVPLWAEFDEVWYKLHYPEFGHLMSETQHADTLTFYDEIGSAMGHSPNPFFDVAFYLERTPAAQVAIESGASQSALDHFKFSPESGDMPHWLFSESYYRQQNSDLSVYDIVERFGKGYSHFLAYGDREWRPAHPFFDPALYVANTTAETDAGKVRNGPFRHLIGTNCAAADRVRVSWYFDPTWYLETYPHVKQEIMDGRWSCALEHYLRNDRPRDFNAVPMFSEAYYLDRYPDVRDAVEHGGEYRNGYAHFISYGAAENRSPHPDVALNQYFAKVDVQADIAAGRYRDSFAHFIGARLTPAHYFPIEITESQAREVLRRNAASLMPSLARRPLDFTPKAERGAPALAVIIVLNNQFDLTISALVSLRACYTGDVELHIVDSGSADETRYLERYIKGADIRHDRQNIGFVDGCNDALARVVAPNVLFMNNDATLDFGAIDAALARINSADNIGAVGGKIIRSNGRLQEAGCIIWRDGMATGYLRNEDPNIPEANFVRDVDFCAAVFLLVRTAAAKSLDGFDIRFRPGYFEETDFCVRLRQAGYRIVYDPAIVVRHYEYASGSQDMAMGAMGVRQEVFRSRNRGFLKLQYPHRAELLTHARSPRTGQKKIFFIEDRVPLRHLGSGFTRSNDIVRTISGMGYHVTVYPIYKAIERPVEIYRNFPDTVEVVYDRGLDEMQEFLAARSGYFDLIWIARTHNIERVSPVLHSIPQSVPINKIILDTEAVSTVRDRRRRKILGLKISENEASDIARELAGGDFCQKMVAVNAHDATLLTKAGFGDVAILGHLVVPRPTPRRFEERRGLLFLGAIHDHESPNLDAAVWFVNVVLPLLAQRLPPDTPLTIAGHVSKFVDLTPLTKRPGVTLVGAIDDPTDLYDRHRLFIAPLRFAAGISYKLHEAAAHGLPIVASELLRHQLGWMDRVDLMAAETSDPLSFVTPLTEVYTDGNLWGRLREGALMRVREENNEALYRSALKEIIERFD